MTETEIAPRPRSDTNNHRKAEQYSHDDKSEDPLEGDSLAMKLGDAQRGCQNAEPETNGIVLKES